MRVQWSGGATRTIKIQLAQRHPLWLGRKLEARKPNPKNLSPNPKNPKPNSGSNPRYPKYPNNPNSTQPKYICSADLQPGPPAHHGTTLPKPSAPPYAHCSQAPTPAHQPAARPPPGLLPHSPLHAARGAQPSLSSMSARQGGPRACGGAAARGERPAGRTRGAEPRAATHGGCDTRRRTRRGARFRPPRPPPWLPPAASSSLAGFAGGGGRIRADPLRARAPRCGGHGRGPLAPSLSLSPPHLAFPPVPSAAAPPSPAAAAHRPRGRAEEHRRAAACRLEDLRHIW
ncbi:hypothetical protein PVAP13_5KG312307 [Panicum virgatum]|uniref:Uncharacterized protein n=1 Tax=Panicum virgatum TaxID=38727 RepID=A0A8T0SLJ7_PANVG|nr:hypothetical protein PVAP13_5KG312307 [Panicum virgatum]